MKRQIAFVILLIVLVSGCTNLDLPFDLPFDLPYNYTDEERAALTIMNETYFGRLFNAEKTILDKNRECASEMVDEYTKELFTKHPRYKIKVTHLGNTTYSVIYTVTPTNMEIGDYVYVSALGGEGGAVVDIETGTLLEIDGIVRALDLRIKRKIDDLIALEKIADIYDLVACSRAFELYITIPWDSWETF